MSHLEEGVLHAMLDGEIGSAELKEIKAHLTACEGCAGRLEEARRFRDEAFVMITALDEQPAAASATDRGPRLRGRKRLPAWAPGLAWAATIFAAIGLGW
ncbi:MAG: zf-HC2 domain-containing protein, partial [Aeromicrobium sp.]